MPEYQKRCIWSWSDGKSFGQNINMLNLWIQILNFRIWNFLTFLKLLLDQKVKSWHPEIVIHEQSLLRRYQPIISIVDRICSCSPLKQRYRCGSISRKKIIRPQCFPDFWLDVVGWGDPIVWFVFWYNHIFCRESINYRLCFTLKWLFWITLV